MTRECARNKRGKMDRVANWLQAERPAFPLWSPVMMGLGVQLFFSAPFEPSVALLSLAPLLAALLLWRFRAGYMRLFLIAMLIISLGFSAAGLRARLVAAPVLSGQVEALAEGVVREVTRTATGRPRLVLDRLVIFGLPAERTPARAQISFRRDEDIARAGPGARISVMARLGPPGGPAEPGGFDYRRYAWFHQLGAIGYARGPLALVSADEETGLLRRAFLQIAAWRAHLSAALREAMPGEAGAFAAAVTVGDRAGISREATEALRASNLAHLLAISGLHIGLVTALVFGATRFGLAAIPRLGRRWRVKHIASVVALLAATGYLLMSGASVATQRAWIMAVVALMAVFFDRPAITLRSLAVAALIVLAIRPESLAEAGFQMSFAATCAIIAGFDYARLKGWTAQFGQSGWRRQIAAWALALLGTSLLAGLATAPFAAYHFNRVPHYGLIANLAAAPVMGFVVAPSALFAAALSPFGLEGPALAVMGRGIDAILQVARFVAQLPGSVSGVKAAPLAALTLISLGGLGFCLGRRIFRPAGFAAALAGAALWFFSGRPEALIAPGAKLVGVVGEEGRALDHERAQSWLAERWLERDGDEAKPKAAALREAFGPGYQGSLITLSNGWKLYNVQGRRLSAKKLSALCAEKTLILAPHAKTPPEGACEFYDAEALARLGAFSVEARGGEIRVISAEEQAGARLWTKGGKESG